MSLFWSVPLPPLLTVGTKDGQYPKQPKQQHSLFWPSTHHHEHASWDMSFLKLVDPLRLFPHAPWWWLLSPLLSATPTTNSPPFLSGRLWMPLSPSLTVIPLSLFVPGSVRPLPLPSLLLGNGSLDGANARRIGVFFSPCTGSRPTAKPPPIHLPLQAYLRPLPPTVDRAPLLPPAVRSAPLPCSRAYPTNFGGPGFC